MNVGMPGVRFHVCCPLELKVRPQSSAIMQSYDDAKVSDRYVFVLLVLAHLPPRLRTIRKLLQKPDRRESVRV